MRWSSPRESDTREWVLDTEGSPFGTRTAGTKNSRDRGRMGLRGSFWYAVISAHPSTLGRVTGADAQGPGWGHHDSSNGSLILEGTRICVVEGLAHANGSHPKRVPLATREMVSGLGAPGFESCPIRPTRNVEKPGHFAALEAVGECRAGL